MVDEELAKLSNFIEQNLRSSQNAGLKFIDSGNLKSRLANLQNHVIFGRRGAGKSTFVSSIRDSENIAIYVDLDVYKDISYPNIIIKVLLVIFEQLKKFTSERFTYWRNPIKKIGTRQLVDRLEVTIFQLTELLELPDTQQQQVRTKVTDTFEDTEGAKLAYGKSSISYSDKQQSGHEQEVSRTVPFDKLDELKKQISSFQESISDISKHFSNRPVFLVLDDFYFIPKALQPDFLDFFHRLTKGTPLFLKVATIKHRSNLYRVGETFIGVQINHDIFPIDLDYTLDRLDDLQEFMANLLIRAIDDSGAETSYDLFITPNGLKQMCLASGGVPRDFLSLFVYLLNRLENAAGADYILKINKNDVTEAAISLVQGKRDSFSIDSADDRVILEEYLSRIKHLIYQEKRTNVFLVSKDDLEKYKQAKQAIKELVDLRFLHLVETNTSSAPSDGRFYEAYMIDIGLYDNKRPRNFTQVEPGVMDDKQRKDSIRACPKINLSNLEVEVSSACNQKMLPLAE